jgi:hypothetical protein
VGNTITSFIIIFMQVGYTKASATHMTLLNSTDIAFIIHRISL